MIGLLVKAVPTDLRRHNSHVGYVEDGSGCWIWTGALNKYGYGITEGALAHRWLFMEDE